MAKDRVLPPQVIEAKLRGDTAALSTMGTNGNKKKARIREVRRAMQAQVDHELSLMADEAFAIERQQITARDAYAHHMRNLAGVSQD
jgi:hypothetical protein